ALDRLDHRRLFAADVGAGAAAQEDRRQRAGRIVLQRLDLLLENRADTGVFVAPVDVDLGNLHRPGGDDHALEETVRIAFEVVTILEGARFAFVDVDRHHPRPLLAAHDAPFAAGRKSRAAEAAQARVLHGLDQRLGIARAVEAFDGEVVAAALAVFGV